MHIDPQSEEWKELWILFGAYLNQDFPDEYGSPADTVHAFCRDSTPEERSNTADQVRRILNGTDDEESTGKAVDAFGLEYHPELGGWTWREWLAELEATLRRPDGSRNDRLDR